MFYLKNVLYAYISIVYTYNAYTITLAYTRCEILETYFVKTNYTLGRFSWRRWNYKDSTGTTRTRPACRTANPVRWNTRRRSCYTRALLTSRLARRRRKRSSSTITSRQTRTSELSREIGNSVRLISCTCITVPGVVMFEKRSFIKYQTLKTVFE